MPRTDVAKVLIFNDTMDCVLLMRDDALSPISCILQNPSLFQEVQRCVASVIGMPPTQQPFWWHIRTEAFPSVDTHMHIFFGKVSMAELTAIEKFNRQTIIVETSSVTNGKRVVAHRLKYLVPMAMVLSSIDSRQWPKP